MLKKLTLLNRLPSVSWQPRKDALFLLLPEEQEAYPDFEQDFATLEQELLPHFRRFDSEALRAQNQFRQGQVVVIFGGAFATILGAVRAAFPYWWGIGIIEALLTAGLGATAWWVRVLKPQERYFTLRLQAEALRSEYFLFLGRIGAYTDDNTRVSQLLRRVADITAGKG